jgi:hypothetical protein
LPANQPQAENKEDGCDDLHDQGNPLLPVSADRFFADPLFSPGLPEMRFHTHPAKEERQYYEGMSGILDK